MNVGGRGTAATETGAYDRLSIANPSFEVLEKTILLKASSETMPKNDTFKPNDNGMGTVSEPTRRLVLNALSFS